MSIDEEELFTSVWRNMILFRVHPNLFENVRSWRPLTTQNSSIGKRSLFLVFEQ